MLSHTHSYCGSAFASLPHIAGETYPVARPAHQALRPAIPIVRLSLFVFCLVHSVCFTLILLRWKSDFAEVVISRMVATTVNAHGGCWHEHISALRTSGATSTSSWL